MTLCKLIYKILNKSSYVKMPNWCNYSLLTLFLKPIRKFLTVIIIPVIPFNLIRIYLYKVCGFKIGTHVFIGMRCYLDDMCYNLLSIGNNVTISYGVYFACHGRNQLHLPIIIEDGVYIGMRATIISKNSHQENKGIRIGKKAIVGACTLVNKDIPDGATVVGIPCKVIKNSNA